MEPIHTAQPTGTQIEALRAYSATHGRTWKSQLRQSWMTGQYEREDRSDVLQQIRNQFGPSWLVNFRLSANPSQEVK